MHTSENSKNINDEHSTILVLGGSGVIGRVIATEFGQRGWSVGIHYHQNRSSAEKTATVIQKANGAVRLYQANVDSPSQIAKLFQSFLQDFESLTLLIWAIGVAPAKLL